MRPSNDTEPELPVSEMPSPSRFVSVVPPAKRIAAAEFSMTMAEPDVSEIAVSPVTVKLPTTSISSMPV